MKRIIILAFLLSLLIGADTAKEVQFFRGSLKSAQQQAETQGKLFFVDFVANYCYLCKMMDETTWRDYHVINYIDENYIPVKVNVDDFDGIVLKQKYNIRVLPTILVFNSKGQVVGRHEESMGGTKMLSLLKSYNIPANRSAPNPSTTTPPAPTPTPPPPVAEEEKPADEKPKPGNTAEAPKPSVSGEGLFEFKVKKRASKGFGVQIGVFGDYGNVLREVEKLDELVSFPILVNINVLDGKTVYRVIVGAFNSRPEAASYSANLLKKGYPGIVKDLSKYK